ncbi:hypothetical protein [Bdellovibrio sp. NC01]|uniref:hypothetical protein n=1 Tax=Bdellovibrio sp. NC01 TaxID=2220073 RepID=UPI0011570B4C|nr:hypothetical protein [Bdellovibrio sp. NC01]QDK36918.1 hypothetical protein DOE51_04580 [Bdellovibrio sp. NC01]
MELVALDKVLEYKNEKALKLYRQNRATNHLSAEAAFQEMLKYLWLTQKHANDLKTVANPDELPKHCVMLFSMREIDEMWHEFILVTKDYTEFCQKYFGKYLHHMPDVNENLVGWRENDIAEVEKLLPYVYDNLGEETLKIWFKQYLE